MDKLRQQPTHPGRVLKEVYLRPLALSINELASALGVSRKTLSKIVNQRGAVTADMALRLSRAFNTSPDFWLTLQKQYDLWLAEHKSTEWQRIQPLSCQLVHLPA